MYFSAKDKGEMMSMIYNWPAQQVDAILFYFSPCKTLAIGDGPKPLQIYNIYCFLTLLFS